MTTISSCFTVHGYNYSDIVLSLTQKKGETKAQREALLRSALSLRDAILEGREVHFSMKPGTSSSRWSGGSSEYAFLADTTAEGRKKALDLWKTDPQKYPASDKNDILGICKFRRIDTNGSLGPIHHFLLNGLDDSHIMDRLMSETWKYHASLFGEGPYSSAGSLARKTRARSSFIRRKLEKSVEAHSLPRKKKRI